VSAMHYTGMAAARFFPASSPDLSHAVTISSLGNNGIVIVTLIVIVAAMTTSSVDRRRNEEHLRLVIDTTPAMIHSARPDGYLDFFNERWLEYLGVSLDDLLGWRWTSVIHSDDLARLVDRWQTALATGKPFEAEARLRRADGEYRLTLHRKVPLRDETGTIVKWYGSVIDIEDRKRAEDELQRQKEVFQKIFEHIPVMIAFFDANGQIGMVNPEWERTLGWTLKEIRERNLDIFAELYPDPRYRQMVREYLGSPSGARREFEVRVRDGSVIDMVARVVQLSDGSTLGIGRDITEQKRAEQAQLRLAAIVASSDDAIISKDMNGIIMSWNDAAERIFGYTRTEAVGQPITIIIPPELSNEEREILRRLRNGEHIQHYETIRVTKQGNKVNVSLTISPMRNSEGQVVGASKIARDITEHLRAEHALQEAQSELARVTRVAAMGELAAAIAHEVNQPLGAVVTNGSASLRWLAGQPPNLEEVREAIERTVREANRASDVIRRIRALLQKGPPQMERLDVNLVILEVLTLSGSEILRGGVVVRTELADVPAVLGDRVQLQQVILNLILNSIDAMSTITDRPRELLVKSSRHPNGVLIQVHDSGEGVDPKQADHIFEAFFTTKPQGIGMGLSIGRSIIEAHGGRLWFTPGSSHGVVFQFTVPKADTSDERAA
ncbi:MAG: PAS domain S-box protein, partial [Terriglobales bacterium]